MICMFYVAVCFIMAAIGSALGYQESVSWQCWAQAILSKIFTLAAVLWITVISFLMYYLTVSNKIFQIRVHHHLLCWGIPIVVTFLPLINTSIGPSSEYDGWCWTVATKDTPAWGLTFWLWLCDYCPVLILAGINAAILVCLKVTYHFSDDLNTKVCLKNVINRMELAPIAIILFYAASILVGNIAYNLKGLVMIIYFWTANVDIRCLWYDYLKVQRSTRILPVVPVTPHNPRVLIEVEDVQRDHDNVPDDENLTRYVDIPGEVVSTWLPD